MVITRAVIDHGFFLNALLGGLEVDPHRTIPSRRCRERCDFESVQTFARISITQPCQKCGGIRVDLHTHPPQSALDIDKRPFDQNQKIAFRKRPKLENLRAGNQRAVDAEKRVLRRRANQPHHAVLDLGEQHILLCLVETVDLIHKQNRPPTTAPARRRRSHDPADVPHIALHPAEPLEMRRRRPCDHLRQRGFSCARRTEENQRRNAVGLDRPP